MDLMFINFKVFCVQSIIIQSIQDPEIAKNHLSYSIMYKVRCTILLQSYIKFHATYLNKIIVEQSLYIHKDIHYILNSSLFLYL